MRTKTVSERYDAAKSTERAVVTDVTGITPPAGPAGLTAYALASMAGPGPGAWPPPERRPAGPSAAAGSAQSAAAAVARSAGRVRGSSGPPATGRPSDQRSGSPAATPRGARARRSGAARGAQVPYVIVLAGLVAGLAYIWQGAHSVRAGTFILAGALFVAVAARLALPERRAGMLASRRRYIDVTALAILAIGLLVAGLVLPTPS